MNIVAPFAIISLCMVAFNTLYTLSFQFPFVNRLHDRETSFTPIRRFALMFGVSFKRERVEMSTVTDTNTGVGNRTATAVKAYLQTARETSKIRDAV